MIILPMEKFKIDEPSTPASTVWSEIQEMSRIGLDSADYTGADTWRRVRSTVSEIKVERRSPIG